MFGYVLPRKGELKVREFEAYQALYCGLCHSLGRRYGFLSRFLLSYDFTFLAMVLAPQDAVVATEKRRCIACPLRGKKACKQSDSLDVAADETVILTVWKLRDNVADSRGLKHVGAKLLLFLFRRAYKKAAARQMAFDRETGQLLAQLARLEAEQSPSLDRTADTFARILQAAAPATSLPERDRAVGELLYHVGRWIYLVDAWDDLAQDEKDGSYNPLLRRFPDGPRAHEADMTLTLGHSLNLAASACQLADFGPWSDTVLNTLLLGLPTVQHAVFCGTWRKSKRALRSLTHGST